MSTILNNWDKTWRQFLDSSSKFEYGRRRFIASSVGLMGTVIALPGLAASTKESKSTATKAKREIDSEPWITIASVYDHLFPEGSDKQGKTPGARQIRATEYLYHAIRFPDVGKSRRKFIESGEKWLNDFSRSKHKKPFLQLQADQKESILRTIEKSDAGGRWLSSLMDYLFEALLADPVYGGNPNGIGWKWLDHTPGFPRPPENKRYFNLS